MRPLAIIPARAGSKRLPGKNRAQIGGKSLTQIAAEHAHAAGLKGFVTSDDMELFHEGVRADWWTSGIKRSAALSGDDVPMIHVVLDAVAHARAMGVGPFDAIVLLQPTSPLRTAADITAALELLESSDAVISVVESPDPEVFTIGHAGRLRPISLSQITDGRRLAVPNGAIYAITTAALDQGLDWWTAPVVTAYEMPPERSVDIDTAVDLERARELWAQQPR